MNVRRLPNASQKRRLIVKARTRSLMGGYQDNPQRLYPLDKATLVVYAIQWYSDPN